MRSFNSLATFGAQLARVAVSTEKAKGAALEEAAKVVKAEAKRVIGTYDYGWPPLAEATVARKGKDTPLLETGETRESIEHRVVGKKDAYVGSNEDKAVWHVHGTHRVPPRDFLGGAAAATEKEVRALLGKKTVAAIVKGR